jgi:endoribonuclease Dicer
MLLPSIMRRIDDFLLVKELDATFFDHAIREDLLHNAICTPSAGLEYDYERLELLGKLLFIPPNLYLIYYLGDAFLKYLSSIYVFVANPALNEGSLHVVRQKIISNKSLLMHSTHVGLPAYIQSKSFPYKTWQPPNFRVIIPPKTPKGTEKKFAEGLKTGDPEGGGMKRDISKAAQSEDGILALDPPKTPPVESVDLDDSLSEQVGDPEVVSCLDTPAIQTQPRDSTDPSRKQQGTVSKKKGKSKKKKAASDEQGIQWLGDKVCSIMLWSVMESDLFCRQLQTLLKR